MIATDICEMLSSEGLRSKERAMKFSGIECVKGWDILRLGGLMWLLHEQEDTADMLLGPDCIHLQLYN